MKKYPYYPIFIDIEDRSVVIIGGGNVCARKAETMMNYGARVTVVSPEFTDEIEGWARDGLKKELTGSKPSEIKAKCIETLRQAGAVVDAKAPGDAAAFKGWLRQISQHVAEASTEGGFLGFGGVPVSEGEKATLNEISSALRLAA